MYYYFSKFMTRTFYCLQNERNQVLTSFGFIRLVKSIIY